MKLFRYQRLYLPVILTILLLSLSTFYVSAIPASFDWGSFSATGSTSFGVYEADQSTVLQTGDLAQLIWVGPDGVVNPPQPDGNPGGDDIILDLSTINNDPPGPPIQSDKGYITLRTYSYDTTNPQNGGLVYLRAWNAAIAANATGYGNSVTATLSSGATFNAPKFWMTTSPTSVTLLRLSASSSNPLNWYMGVILVIFIFGMFAIVVNRLRFRAMKRDLVTVQSV